MASLSTGSGSTTTSVVVSSTYADLRIDQFRGFYISISGDVRKILGNTEREIVLTAPLSSAPASSTSFTVVQPFVSLADGSSTSTYAGSQNQNARLANFIGIVLSQVEAFVSAA